MNANGNSKYKLRGISLYMALVKLVLEEFI